MLNQIMNNFLDDSLLDELNKILSEDIDVIKERENSVFDQLSSPLSESIVLFGAGSLGIQTLQGLQSLGIMPIAFSDNNPALWNKIIDGVKVISPHDVVNKYKDQAVFLITIWNPKARFAQIKQKLLNLNCVKVISVFSLFWKYPEIFLPNYSWDLPHKILQQKEDVTKAFHLWSDNESRLEYLAQIKLKMFLDFDNLPEPINQESYFLDNLFTFLPDEIFVDCGAFDGDTLKSFVNLRKSEFKKYIALEPDVSNLEYLKEYISSQSIEIQNKVEIYPYAVASERKKVFFNAIGTPAASITENGNIEIECVALDEIINDCCPTFIKMDIEGSEIDALIGASNIIKKYQPILAICVYHKPNDLWQIPLLINSLYGEYNFFLKAHEEDSFQVVCYAIPRSRIQLIKKHCEA